MQKQCKLEENTVLDINPFSRTSNQSFGKKLKIAIACVIAFILYSYSALALTEERIILLNSAGDPPVSTESRTGFLDEVVAEALRTLGYKLQTVRLPAERALKSSNQGVIDGELLRVKGLDKLYPNLIRVPEKIMDLEFVVFSYTPINLEKGWSALSGKSVAYLNGWKILEKNVPSDSEVTKIKDVKMLFKLLKKHRTDYVLYERWAGLTILKTQKIAGVKLQQPPLAVKEMYVYLHKKHKDLVPKLAAAILAMKQDGRYQALLKKHFQPLE